MNPATYDGMFERALRDFEQRREDGATGEDWLHFHREQDYIDSLDDCPDDLIDDDEGEFDDDC